MQSSLSFNFVPRYIAQTGGYFKDEGLKLAITTPGANSDMTVRYLAITNGLSPDRDFEIVPLGGMQSQIAGMQAGQVDGCACLPGMDILTRQQGLTVDLVKPGELTKLDGVTSMGEISLCPWRGVTSMGEISLCPWRGVGACQIFCVTELVAQRPSIHI